MKLHVLILILLSSISLFGQDLTKATSPQSKPDKEDDTIKVETLLLNLPVIVSDRNGRNISGLTKDDFVVTEDNNKQPIAFFSDEYAPLSVAIIVDTSGSTVGIRGNIKSAARAFLKNLRPEDKAMVVSFDGQYKILSELTSDQNQLRKALGQLEMLQLEGSTMYDAIVDVANNKFAGIKGRKAIILLTDGIEGSRVISYEQLIYNLSESDTVIYTILFNFPDISKYPVFISDLDYIKTIASVTAGRVYDGSSDLKAVFQNIADELKRQYSIGFYPQSSAITGTSEIKVIVNRENTVIRTKGKISLKNRINRN